MFSPFTEEAIVNENLKTKFVLEIRIYIKRDHNFKFIAVRITYIVN